jgi:hypothetical protein
MVLAPERVAVSHGTAASAAASLHLRREATVVETEIAVFAEAPEVSGLAVLAPQQGITEWYPDPAQDLTPLGPLAAAAAVRGWRVMVVVPTGRMGEAHRALRGAPAMLQPWWSDGDQVRFGGPEVP